MAKFCKTTPSNLFSCMKIVMIWLEFYWFTDGPIDQIGNEKSLVQMALGRIWRKRLAEPMVAQFTDTYMRHPALVRCWPDPTTLCFSFIMMRGWCKLEIRILFNTCKPCAGVRIYRPLKFQKWQISSIYSVVYDQYENVLSRHVPVLLLRHMVVVLVQCLLSCYNIRICTIFHCRSLSTCINLQSAKNQSHSTCVCITHWRRVTHICVGNTTIIGSDNGLSPGRRQAIIWTNAGILSIGPLGTNFGDNLIEIHVSSFKKMHLKMSSGKWRPFSRPQCVKNHWDPLW